MVGLAMWFIDLPKRVHSFGFFLSIHVFLFRCGVCDVKYFLT